MATLKTRRQANGSIWYTAIVRKRVGKTIVHREAKTFTHRSAALSWARHREVELDPCPEGDVAGHSPRTVAHGDAAEGGPREVHQASRFRDTTFGNGSKLSDVLAAIDGFTCIGVGQVGQALLALLFFLYGGDLRGRRVSLIDKDKFEVEKRPYPAAAGRRRSVEW